MSCTVTSAETKVPSVPTPTPSASMLFKTDSSLTVAAVLAEAQDPTMKYDTAVFLNWMRTKVACLTDLAIPAYGDDEVMEELVAKVFGRSMHWDDMITTTNVRPLCRILYLLSLRTTLDWSPVQRFVKFVVDDFNVRNSNSDCVLGQGLIHHVNLLKSIVYTVRTLCSGSTLDVTPILALGYQWWVRWSAVQPVPEGFVSAVCSWGHALGGSLTTLNVLTWAHECKWGTVDLKAPFVFNRDFVTSLVEIMHCVFNSTSHAPAANGIGLLSRSQPGLGAMSPDMFQHWVRFMRAGAPHVTEWVTQVLHQCISADMASTSTPDLGLLHMAKSVLMVAQMWIDWWCLAVHMVGQVLGLDNTPNLDFKVAYPLSTAEARTAWTTLTPLHLGNLKPILDVLVVEGMWAGAGAGAAVGSALATMGMDDMAPSDGSGAAGVYDATEGPTTGPTTGPYDLDPVAVVTCEWQWLRTLATPAARLVQVLHGRLHRALPAWCVFPEWFLAMLATGMCVDGTHVSVPSTKPPTALSTVCATIVRCAALDMNTVTVQWLLRVHDTWRRLTPGDLSSRRWTDGVMVMHEATSSDTATFRVPIDVKVNVHQKLVQSIVKAVFSVGRSGPGAGPGACPGPGHHHDRVRTMLPLDVIVRFMQLFVTPGNPDGVSVPSDTATLAVLNLNSAVFPMLREVLPGIWTVDSADIVPPLPW